MFNFSIPQEIQDKYNEDFTVVFETETGVNSVTFQKYVDVTGKKENRVAQARYYFNGKVISF